jgi:redox-sensitive bicupin YhaK (pirin superfamily)
MTAGKGVIHSEMPSRAMQSKGGTIHGFQLWVNLPKAKKMIAPRYQDTKSASLPLVKINGGTVKVISGRFQNKESPIQTTWPVHIFDITLSKGAEFTHEVESGWTSIAYVFQGNGLFSKGDELVYRSQMAILSDKEQSIYARGESENALRFLLLTGQKINEPIARYGPFVMNTDDELQQAYDDFRNGKF